MNESLKQEILIQCQNVQCGAKLAAEIHYIFKETKYQESEDIIFIDGIIKFFPELKYFINFHSDEMAKTEGWKNLFIYKYDGVNKLIDEIENLKDKNSALYHFACGKLFGYNDYEVISFIKNNCK